MLHNQYTKFPSKKQRGKETPIYSGVRVVGKVVGKTFRKSISGSKHMLRQPPAIAISVDALDAAEKAGAERVEVFDRETLTTYAASIVHLRTAGFMLNRGFGEQIALPLDGWMKTRRGGGGGAPAQLSMWGAANG